MIETLVITLIMLWLMGVVSAYTMGGSIHLLLLIALAVMLARFLKGRRSVE